MAQEHLSAILKNAFFTETSLSGELIKGPNADKLRAVRRWIGKLHGVLLRLQSILDDAKERRFLAGKSNRWVDAHVLDGLLYEAEDILHELSIQLGMFGKVSSKNKNAPTVSDLGIQLRSLYARFMHLLREPIFAFNKSSEQPNGSSFVEVSKLHGLDEVKEKIMNVLLGESRSDGIQTISIIGMEGMGKTTLARCICYDDRVLANFEDIIWVNVSGNFDLGKIARAILHSFEGLDHDTLCILALAPLQSLLNRIHRNIVRKKSLFVLDDVGIYHGDHWQALRALLQQGMPESKIIVTARENSVALTMKSSHIFHLKELSDEECWIILRQVAFAGRNEGSHENLEDTGREIAKKCKGLPFAAKILGGLLQHKTRRDEWDSILNNEIWKSRVTPKYIFKPLWLCYCDLPPAVRRCLLYCAIFPKHFEVSKSLLVQHWMAQGYLDSTDDSQMELKGEEHFECLVARSFFQDCSRWGDDRMHAYRMYSIVYDFLQSLSPCEFRRETKSVENMMLNFCVSGHCTLHLILMIALGVDFPLKISGADKLRSLVAVIKGCVISSQALRNLFSKLKHLRLLDLSLTSGWRNCFGPCGYGNIVCEIPEEIYLLRNLRYLNLAGCREMKILPEILCDLHDLQSLDLTGCTALSKLPDALWKLVNLKYLCTWRCSSLTFYPKGIGKLTSLREFTNVIARADCNDAKEFSLGDLEKLDHLRGILRMKLVGNAIDADEASRANLQNKEHLDIIKIHLDGHPKEEVVIKALNPPSDLKIEFTAWWF